IVSVREGERRNSDMSIESRHIFKGTAHGAMDLRLALKVRRLRRQIQPDQWLQRNGRCIERGFGLVVSCEIQTSAAADKAVQCLRLRVQGGRRDVLRNLGLERYTVDRLILNLKLRYLRRELQARIIKRTTALGVQVQSAGEIHISCPHSVELIQTDAIGLEF